MSNLIIIGSSGHAEVVIDIINASSKHSIIGLIDDFRNVGEFTRGHQILGTQADISSIISTYRIDGTIIAVGDNYSRGRLWESIHAKEPSIKLISAIHPRACIGSNVTIGCGSVIMAGTTINTGVSIGKCCIVNTNSSVDHGSVVGDFSSIAPHAAIGGNCRIGNFTAINMGAIVIHNISVGDHTVIGAGSTVLHSISSYLVAYGSPAKPIRSRLPSDTYL